MKRIFQSVVTIFVGVSFILLSGCPKKITPKKSSRVVRVRPAPSAKLPKPPKETLPRTDEGLGATSTPLQEEEIPRIAKLEDLGETPAKNENTDQEEKVSALNDVFFDLDQWTLRESDLAVIEENANWIIAHPNVIVRIEGHGDSRGTNEYNLVLGEKRADSVKNSMVKLGVTPTRLIVMSYGEERPFCANEEDRCYAENRRAHFHVD